MSTAPIERIRQNVPQMLRDLSAWLLHDPDKVPIYANGTNRRGNLDSPEDRSKLVTFEQAAAALATVRRACGLGIALGEVPGEEIRIVGIDLDTCYRGDELEDRALQILGAANSYAERSLSGKGLHVLGTGDIGTLKIESTTDRPGLELYSGQRYFTVTGDRLNGAHVADITEAAALARQLFAGPALTSTESREQPEDNDIVMALNRAGLYLRDAGDSKHLIRCPWEARHSPNDSGSRQTSSSEAAYFAPGAVVRGELIENGMYRCQHAHCADRRLRHLREFLGLQEGPRHDQQAGGEWSPPSVTSYGAAFDPARIPLRRWLLGSRRSVGEVTIDAGPPGSNKSTLMLTDAVAIATGRQILADKVHEIGGALCLWGEDARRDVEARLAGILELYRIQPAELGDRLHVVYLAEIDPITYTLAQMAEDMATLNQRMLGWLRDFPNTIAVFVDPLMAWHRLMENSNEAIQLLSTSLRGIAVQGKRHVGIDHHVTKITMADPEGHVGNLASVRGAGSLIGYTRWAFTLARLNSETAAAHGIPDQERSRFRRLDSLKASYGPDDERMRLLRVESVTIANGESVGVLVEQDLEMLRAEGKEREVGIKDAKQRKLTEALTRMLTESRPRSANAAALWLITHSTELVQGKNGETLSEFSVRRRLPAMIGTGLSTRFNEHHTRIVIRPAAKNGRGSEIDFACEVNSP